MDVGRLEVLTMGTGGFVGVGIFWFNFNVEVEGCLLLLLGAPTLFEVRFALPLSVSIIALPDCVQEFCLGLNFLRLHSKLSNLFGPSLLFRLVLDKSFSGWPSTSTLTLLWSAGSLRKLLAIKGFESLDFSLLKLIFSFAFPAKVDFDSEMTKVLERVLRGAGDGLDRFPA